MVLNVVIKMKTRIYTAPAVKGLRDKPALVECFMVTQVSLDGVDTSVASHHSLLHHSPVLW